MPSDSQGGDRWVRAADVKVGRAQNGLQAFGAGMPPADDAEPSDEAALRVAASCVERALAEANLPPEKRVLAESAVELIRSIASTA